LVLMPLYTNQESINEFNDASGMDTPTLPRYNWQSILPPDVFNEVKDLFLDKKSPADFMKHSIYRGQQNASDFSSPWQISQPDDPPRMQYGELLGVDTLDEFNEAIPSSGVDSDFVDSWYKFGLSDDGDLPEDSILNRINELGPNYFNDSIDDIDTWLNDSAENDTFPFGGLFGNPDWVGGGDAGIPSSHYVGDNRQWPYYALRNNDESGNSYNTHYTNQGTINEDMRDTFQGGATTGQNLLSTVDLFDPNSIASALTEVADAGTPITHAPPLDNNMIRRLRGSYYRPMLKDARKSTYDAFGNEMAAAQSVGKGFAGYGGRNLAVNSLVDIYNKQIGGTMSSIREKRGEARQEVGDVISDWRNLIEGS
jgi:hypothetical protein